jgi:hypothetical protein
MDSLGGGGVMVHLDLAAFFTQFQDYLAPKLDTYEQAIYLYVFRHSRMIGQDEIVIGFKSARRRLALGHGKAGSPMSEGRCYIKLRSLEAKGCLQLRGSERSGTRIHLLLPEEMPNLVRVRQEDAIIDIEDMDFFSVAEHRRLILQREDYKCFYCLCKLNVENHVIEHVVSRPIGSSGYRNVVAACRECNNRKGSIQADDFLRTLYRDGFLTGVDLQDRLAKLEHLRAGILKPMIDSGQTNG